MLHKVIINWQGEILTFYTVAKNESKALSNAIRQLAKRLGRTVKSVRDYVLDNNFRRWEVGK